MQSGVKGHAALRVAGTLLLGLLLILQAGCGTSAAPPAAGAASGGKATVIIGYGIRMPGLEQYRRDKADGRSRVEQSILSPVDGITFKLHRFDPTTRKPESSGFFGLAGSNDITVGIDVSNAFVNEFAPAAAMTRTILTFGLSAATRFDLDTMRYRAYAVEAGRWTMTEFVTNKLQWPVNHITHHILVTKEGVVRPGAHGFEVRPGEVVYVGDMVLEVPLRRSGIATGVFYSVDPWKMRVTFDPAAMAAGFESVSRYPAIHNRPMRPLR